VELIHATDSGLVYPDTIADSLLPNDSDVVVTVNPGHFRTAPDDHKAIAKSKGAQIRLDWVQTRPIMNLLKPMAWAGLAAWSVSQTTGTVTPKKNVITGAKENTRTFSGPAIPDLEKDLNFKDPNDPNAPSQNQVILPGGSGRVALNMQGVHPNPRLQSILTTGVNYSSIIAPFFGFAPLALPALKALTDLLCAVFNHEAVIIIACLFRFWRPKTPRMAPTMRTA
jgi:hypothetical protein